MTTPIYTKTEVSRLAPGLVTAPEAIPTSGPLGIAKHVLASEGGKTATGFRVFTTDCVEIGAREFRDPASFKIQDYQFGRPLEAADLDTFNAIARENVRSASASGQATYIDRNGKLAFASKGATIISAETLASAVLDRPATDIFKI
jgi:hypothetical protein